MMREGKGAIAIPFLKGGIRHRLLVWNLSVFGLVLFGIVLASYLYLLRQIKHNKFEQQEEIASLVAVRIESFVTQKIERLSDTALSMSLYPVGSQRQQLLANLLLKTDQAITNASILDSKGVEVVKVSERRIYAPSEFSDQSESEKFNKAIRGDTYISPVYTSDKAEPYVTLAVALRAPSHEIVGVVSAE